MDLPFSLTQAKDTAQTVQAVFTSCGIAAGLFWFFRRRQRYPRVQVTHETTHWPIANGKNLLRVRVNVVNQGAVLLPISLESFITIRQIRPLSPDISAAVAQGNDLIKSGETEALWPLLDEQYLRGVKEIEPGESDEFHCDFFLDEHIQTVRIYTYFKNESKGWRLLRRKPQKPEQELGWKATSTYDLQIALPSAVTGDVVHDGVRNQRSRGGGKSEMSGSTSSKPTISPDTRQGAPSERPTKPPPETKPVTTSSGTKKRGNS